MSLQNIDNEKKSKYIQGNHIKNLCFWNVVASKDEKDAKKNTFY